MIHYVYLGHFEREGNFIRFEKQADTSPAWYRPVVVLPLDEVVVAELLAEKDLTPSTVPDDWGISFEEEGFLACDEGHSHRGLMQPTTPSPLWQQIGGQLSRQYPRPSSRHFGTRIKSAHPAATRSDTAS